MVLKRAVFAIFTVFLLIQVTSASFIVDLNVSSVKNTYNVGDTISGNIAISFENESIDTIISTNVGGGTTTLGEWIKASGKRENYEYNCSSKGCLPLYKAKNAISNVNLQAYSPKLFGFKTSGSNVSIRSLSFNLDSNLPNSCSLPYSIDAFNVGKYVLSSQQYTSNVCSKPQQGCFDYSLPLAQYQTVNLTNSPYCEKINLIHAPAYLLGANLTKPSVATEEIISMELYNADFTIYYGNCTFSSLQSNTSCIIPYPITQDRDYNVCVLSNTSNSPYLIRTEFFGSICGSANRGQSNTRDFDIFANQLEYSSAISTFDNESFAMMNNEQDFAHATNEYLTGEYASSCLNNDCFIPFKIVGDKQQIDINSVSLVYESDGVPITDNTAYEIEKSASTIRSGRIVLPLENTKLKISQKSDTLQINIGNRTAVRINANISIIPLDIRPTFALIGIPTTFSAISNEKILTAIWKFSNDPLSKSGINISQTFTQAASYTVEVTATTESGKIYTRSQQILVGEPRASAEELYQLSQQSIASLSTDLNTVPSWILPGITKHINIVSLNNSLLAIKEKMNVASNDTEFVQIIEQLRALNIPSDVSIIRTGQLPIIAAYGNINVDYVNSIHQTEVDAEKTKAALAQWTTENYNSQIETNTYAVSTLSGESEPLLTKVKVTLSPKGSSPTQPYLIIDYPLEAIHFLQGYSPKEVQGGTYIVLGNSDSIEFYLEGDIAPNNLGIYILPSLNELESSSDAFEIARPEKDKRKNVIYSGLGAILAILIIAMIALQYWYRNNYQKYLFGDEENLFNIMTFIYNAKKKGLKEGDMRKALLTSGWKREQISYALGRFSGKILGIFGIPIYSSRQEEKVRSTIESRQRQNTGRKVY
jgi:hypothetical protein